MTGHDTAAGDGEEPYALARRIVFHVIDAGLGPGDRVDPWAASTGRDAASPRSLAASLRILREIGFLEPGGVQPGGPVALTSDIQRFQALVTLGQIARIV
ncbi:MAG TPA: hypothetical protein VJ870_20505 [Amycolatopsis sp.]|nr:hypothetical protein [Amycolatopsis sp.]